MRRGAEDGVGDEAREPRGVDGRRRVQRVTDSRERGEAPVHGPHQQRPLTGQGDDAPGAGERVVRQHTQRVVDDARPIDPAVVVHVDPEVVHAGIPGPPLEDDQRRHAADDRVHQCGRHLDRGTARGVQVREHVRVHLPDAILRQVGRGLLGAGARRDRPPPALALLGHHCDGVHPRVVRRDAAQSGTGFRERRALGRTELSLRVHGHHASIERRSPSLPFRLA